MTGRFSVVQGRYSVVIRNMVGLLEQIQGDHLGCAKPPIDIDLEAAFLYEVFILKRNFHINVIGRFCAT